MDVCVVCECQWAWKNPTMRVSEAKSMSLRTGSVIPAKF